MPVPMGLEVRFDRPPHPAAPPPPEAMLGNVGSVAARAMLSEVVVTGAREKDKAEPASTPIARYAPGTQLQAGPGGPGWGDKHHPIFLARTGGTRGNVQVGCNRAGNSAPLSG